MLEAQGAVDIRGVSMGLQVDGDDLSAFGEHRQE
jgi:hypothetical protein